MSDVAQAFRRLERWGWERGWMGTDPYDGLNATRLASPLKRSRIGRRLLTQAVKRSPVDLRPLLGIPPRPSAATSALVTSAYALQHVLPDAETSEKLERTIHDLLAQRLPGFDEPCWGYHFDVQTRVFFYPEGSPNTIATAFAGFALLDAHARTERADLLELATGVCRFFVERVPQTEAEGGAFFGYLVDDRTPIHNANMLVAALLARCGQATQNADLLQRATRAAAYTVSRQHEDGSWPYGELSHLGWIDNFHTAYVLMCLHACAQAGVEGCEAALETGLRFYADQLFLADGTPKYMPNSVHPIDGQCAAEAIRIFALAGMHDSAQRTFSYAQRTLARKDGAYAFQRERLWVNRQPHMRWVEAPFLVALATFAEAAR